jgi:hypothetical protein
MKKIRPENVTCSSGQNCLRAALSKACLGRRHLPVAAAALAALATVLSPLHADTINVPNGSFESQVAPPSYPYVTTLIDSWQKPAKPAYFDESAYGLLWDQTAGLFQNTPAGYPNHIDNMDGNQGLYLLAFPQVGLFQDYNSTDWNHSTPLQAFNARFEVGQGYRLTVGVIGGGGGMPEGTSMMIGFYYRDGANNLVTFASTPITYTLADFPNTTHLMDYSVTVPAVQAGDAWANQYIGVELLNTSGTGTGYWDLDNVRLESVPEPATLGLLALGVGGLLVARLRPRRQG